MAIRHIFGTNFYKEETTFYNKQTEIERCVAKALAMYEPSNRPSARTRPKK